LAFLAWQANLKNAPFETCFHPPCVDWNWNSIYAPEELKLALPMSNTKLVEASFPLHLSFDFRFFSTMRTDSFKPKSSMLFSSQSPTEKELWQSTPDMYLSLNGFRVER